MHFLLWLRLLLLLLLLVLLLLLLLLLVLLLLLLRLGCPLDLLLRLLLILLLVLLLLVLLLLLLVLLLLVLLLLLRLRCPLDLLLRLLLLLLLLELLLPLALLLLLLLLRRHRSWSLMWGYLCGTRSSSPWLEPFFRGGTTESFLPPSPLATMVHFIETLVITLTFSVSGPIGILSPEILPVMRVSLIPRIPLRPIPVIGSDNIGGRIRVIRSPSVLRSEKIIQQTL
jgi:hypothetical protein